MRQLLYNLYFFPKEGGSFGKRPFSEFIIFAVQLTVLFAVIYSYQIETSQGLTQIIIPIGISLLITYWLPKRIAPLVMMTTTWGLILFAFGLFGGTAFIVIILLFLLIAHLPLPYTIRILILLICTLGLITINMQWLYIPRISIITPWLGSMLMFRFILYMYELKHEKQNVEIAISQRLAYIFIPVNLAMPLFPVIDFKTFIYSQKEQRSSVLDKLAFRRIMLGILCLLCYRLCYHIVPNTATIQYTDEALLYIFLSYTLILRMLGLFWIAIGIIGLYGFTLPPVFDNAFFITGFGQIWRKINIYWRSFVTKVFYYPIFFRIRKKTRFAVLVASLCVFIITWQLHAWQWFWIRGFYLFKFTDLIYWLILGACISINLSIESKKEGSSIPFKSSWTHSLAICIRVVGMFIFMSTLWSLWNSPSIRSLFFLLFKITNPRNGLYTWLSFIAAFVGITLILTTLYYFYKNRQTFAFLKKKPTSITIILLSIFLLIINWSKAQEKLPKYFVKYYNEFTSTNLNAAEQEEADQGYYEKLVSQKSTENPWAVSIKSATRSSWFEEATISTKDIRLRILKKSYQVEYDGIVFSTNIWGMRDRFYTKQKPVNSFRIALLGGSYEMGSGVSNNEVFESIIEKKLNDSLKKAGSNKQIEILNFSVGGYHLPQQVWLCNTLVFQFNPDMIIYVAHSDEARRLNGIVARVIQNNIDPIYPTLKSIIHQSESKQNMSRNEIRNRLFPYNKQMLIWGYREIALAAQKNHAHLTIVYLPAIGDNVDTNEYNNLMLWTKIDSGSSINLSNVYGNTPIDLLRIGANDNHPNAIGHQKIVNALYPKFSKIINDQLNK